MYCPLYFAFIIEIQLVYFWQFHKSCFIALWLPCLTLLNNKHSTSFLFPPYDEYNYTSTLRRLSGKAFEHFRLIFSVTGVNKTSYNLLFTRGLTSKTTKQQSRMDLMRDLVTLGLAREDSSIYLSHWKLINWPHKPENRRCLDLAISCSTRLEYRCYGYSSVAIKEEAAAASSPALQNDAVQSGLEIVYSD